MDRPDAGTVWVLTGYDSEFLAVFATREAAEEGRPLHIEADRRRCAASPMETVRDTPWTPPDTAVFEASVHEWPPPCAGLKPRCDGGD
ncbi:unannotated protein [freshwater metagenome]|uniref:Unannotated protein n=1 Tax=freshwater metagenome TaxID=449393 RepID=A0A6J6RY88_9ZZZZ